ncbi:MAG: hypothetical protein M3347_06465 [Armatimonadota bacterium]|nr:hypothetical protein [Armatimonadota bacterium]
MTVVIQAHFDGKVIVPDEPVDLPLNQPLIVELKLEEMSSDSSTEANQERIIEERLRRLREATGRIQAPEIPLEALRRENLYEERW